jgi:hypothetical protein
VVKGFESDSARPDRKQDLYLEGMSESGDEFDNAVEHQKASLMTIMLVALTIIDMFPCLRTLCVNTTFELCHLFDRSRLIWRALANKIAILAITNNRVRAQQDLKPS